MGWAGGGQKLIGVPTRDVPRDRETSHRLVILNEIAKPDPEQSRNCPVAPASGRRHVGLELGCAERFFLAAFF
jgi:hypothetical protein